jgi:hypothetical protein
MFVDDPRQKEALTNIVAALTFSFTYILIGALYFPFRIPVTETMLDRIIFSWQCLLFAALPLAAGIVAVMFRKLLRPSTLEGDPVNDGSRLDIHIRFVRDTTPQLLLLTIAVLNAAIYLEGAYITFVPTTISWFIFARIFYWIAYMINPAQRIFGAVASMAPSCFLLIWCAIRIAENTTLR